MQDGSQTDSSTVGKDRMYRRKKVTDSLWAFVRSLSICGEGDFDGHCQARPNSDVTGEVVTYPCLDVRRGACAVEAPLVTMLNGRDAWRHP